MSARNLGVRILLALAAFAVTHAVLAQNAPKKYQDLYRELDAQLSAFERRLPPVSSGKRPIRAATLLSASCQRGEIILGGAQRENTLRELDALKSLGADGVVLQVCYPLLTPAFRDPQPFLDYYANLANEVRARGMKLLVEHNSVLSAYASVDARPYYRKLTKQRFGRERYEELKVILLSLQPDYLTLVSEPHTDSGGLKLTVKEWRTYVQRSVDTLSQQLGSFPTLLGAGSGLWDDFEYVEAFAGVKGLSYVDLHLYPLVSGGQSNLERTADMARAHPRHRPGQAHRDERDVAVQGRRRRSDRCGDRRCDVESGRIRTRRLQLLGTAGPEVPARRRRGRA